MSIKKLLLGSLLILLLAGKTWSAELYMIDPVHSTTAFSVRHMMLSNVKGNFKDFSGTIQFDEQDLKKSSASVVIKTASINTGEEKRDAHLRSPDFFDAQKYPEMTFKSSEVQENAGALVLIGALTMRGVSKQIAIPFTYLGKIKDPGGNTRIGFEGSVTLNRQDYGVSWNKALDNGGLIVGNEVKVSLTIEAVKK